MEHVTRVIRWKALELTFLFAFLVFFLTLCCFPKVDFPTKAVEELLLLLSNVLSMEGSRRRASRSSSQGDDDGGDFEAEWMDDEENMVSVKFDEGQMWRQTA